MQFRYRHEKCSICGVNEALIFVKVMQEEAFREKGLCAECAIKYMQDKSQIDRLDFIDKRVVEALEEMRGLLTSIVSNISTISTMIKTTNDTVKCTSCGLTYEDFKNGGYFGCPSCYYAFHNHIREIILEIERGVTHQGKFPERYLSLFRLKKEIKHLKNQLKQSVITENYEQANKIKKRLDKLTGNMPVGKEDEIY
jgi:protein arginine kinase activator